MDVDQSAFPSPDEPRREDSHVAAEHHEFHIGSFEFGIHKPFMGNSALILLNFHRQRYSDACDTGVAAVLETTCVCLVSDDEGGAVAARCALVSEKCGEPRAAARYQYC